jgi:hypothetical protein
VTVSFRKKLMVPPLSGAKGKKVGNTNLF